MQWTTRAFPERDGSGLPDLRSARRQVLYIEGKIAAATWEAIAAELPEYWIQLTKEFERCLPAAKPFDLLHIQIEPEGGQVKAYLGDSTNPNRASPIVVNGIIGLVDEAYESLPDPEEFEEEFEEQIIALRERARDAVLAALKNPAAAKAIKEFASQHGLSFLMHWESSDEGEPVPIPL